MNDDDELFLQVVHITDPHFVEPNFPRWSQVAGWRRHLQSALQFLSTGMNGHDSLAEVELEDFLRALTADPGLANVPTWLVTTGDVSTFGDYPSIDMGLLRQDGWATILETEKHFAIWGNHDAWPGAMPRIGGQDARIPQQQSWLPSRFPRTSLRHHLTVKRKNSEHKVVLFALDTVACDAAANFWANGRVEPSSLQALVGEVDNHSSPGDVRIVATHHPICYPGGAPLVGMSLLSADQVALALGGSSPTRRCAPLGHVVLSGHVHQACIKAPPPPPDPLAPDQHQLTAGTAIQLDTSAVTTVGDMLKPARVRWPHLFQILRFYDNQHDERRVVIERAVVGRPNGQRRFRVKSTEDIVLSV